jgi:Inhibitor of Apoptosis domain
MALAGFYYTPTDDSEDMVNCPYCLIGLDGWEPKDDPMYSQQFSIAYCLGRNTK